jgi:hypothetical protein
MPKGYSVPKTWKLVKRNKNTVKKECPVCTEKVPLIESRNMGSLLVLMTCPFCNAAFDWYLISRKEQKAIDDKAFSVPQSIPVGKTKPKVLQVIV